MKIKNFVLTSLLLISSSAILSSCDKETHFADVFSWGSEITMDNVKSIDIIKGYIGVAPGYQVSSIDTLNEKDDISTYVNWINDITLKKGVMRLVGGSYVELEFFLVNEESHKVRINNGMLIINSMYYTPSIALPSLD